MGLKMIYFKFWDIICMCHNILQNFIKYNYVEVALRMFYHKALVKISL